MALVTGAGRGLGRAIAIALAERGFDVVATMRDPHAGAGLPAGIEVRPLDITDPSTYDIPDGLRVLVNNAGIDGAYLPVEHTPPEQWRALLDTNFLGPAALIAAALPALRAARCGVVCNVTSVSILAPMPLFASYRAGKAALSALGESLRAELAPFGVRVLEVLPGPIQTDMLSASDREPESAAFPAYDEATRFARDGRRSVESAATPAADAAAAIVDAICDDESPLRVGCDPLSVALLEAWRGQDDESWMRSMLP